MAPQRGPAEGPRSFLRGAQHRCKKGKAGFAFFRKAKDNHDEGITKMKMGVRVNSLTLGGAGDKTLSAMEKHGKRLDQSSQRRKVRDVEPLVYGSLDLRDAFDRHVDGAKMNKSLKRPVLHALVQFPKDLAINAKVEEAMLNAAVQFINASHGGNAVFAARLDRDEAGRHTVDVFFSPKYEKITKTGKSQGVWISTSRHGKELAIKHQDHIRKRHPTAKLSKPLTGPRHVGMALQEELYEFMSGSSLKLEPRQFKAAVAPDRKTPEQLKAEADAKSQKASLDEREKQLAAREAEIKAKEAQLDEQQETFQAHSEMQEIQRRDLRKRAENLAKVESKLKSFASRISSVVRFLGDTLGLKLPDKLHDAVREIEQHANELSREEPAPESRGPSF